MSNQSQPVFPTQQQQQPNLNSAHLSQLFVKPFNSALKIKRSVITDDYSVTSQVLGMGINGRVLEIFHRETGQKYALKMLQDCPEARREVELHWRVSPCPHVVPIIDVYENLYQGRKCLLIVMECMDGGMKRRICRGQYEFPNPEWSDVSEEAKQLICHLLKTEPTQRMSINEFINHPWINQSVEVPQTPLHTSRVLHEEQDVWEKVKEEMTNALQTMRVDYDQIKMKTIEDSTNPLLLKRRKKTKNTATQNPG